MFNLFFANMMAQNYFSVADFAALARKCEVGTSFIHMNVQSARNKEDEIHALITNLELEFDMIMVTETWYRDESEVMKLPKYTSCYLNRNLKKGGGVMIMAKNNKGYAVVDRFSKSTADYEILTVQNGRDVYSVMYRPPTGNFSSFLAFCETYLCWINEHQYSLALGGDLKIYFLRASPIQTDFCRLLEANACTNVIRTPTRVQATTATVIDNFITNILTDTDNLSAGVLTTPISDHLPIFLLQSFKTINEFTQADPPDVFICTISPNTLDYFASKLHHVDLTPVLQWVDANEASNKFIHAFQNIYEQCFPLKLQARATKARRPFIMQKHLLQ